MDDYRFGMLEKAKEIINNLEEKDFKRIILDLDDGYTDETELTITYVYVFSERQNPMRNGSPVDENGKKWSSTMCFAWYVWEQGYEGEPIMRWL